MMKVLIPYSKKITRSSEGLRLRKTLKGECESAGIEWVDHLVPDVDLAHFLCPSDDALAIEAYSKNIPYVVSAFYAENDPFAGFSDRSAKVQPALSQQTVRFLNHAGAVYVPNATIKGLLLGNGITSNIEVHAPSIRLERFSENSLERQIFPRYYRVRPQDKIVVLTGEFEDKERIQIAKELSELCPTTEFYYFGCSKQNVSRAMRRLQFKRKTPHNLHFKSQEQDDVYRSALMCASAYINLDSLLPDSFRVLEAFAAKVPVLSLGGAPLETLLQNNVTCLEGETAGDLAKLLEELYSGEAKSTIIAAYKMAGAHSLQKGGEELASLYHKIIKNK